MRTFTTEEELDEVYEVVYRTYSYFGNDDTDDGEVKTFPTEASARKWIKDNDKRIIQFNRITKIKL